MKRLEIDIEKALSEDGYNTLVVNYAKNDANRLRELGYSFSCWASDIWAHDAVIFDTLILQKYSYRVDKSDIKGATYLTRSHYILKLIKTAAEHHELQKRLLA